MFSHSISIEAVVDTIGEGSEAEWEVEDENEDDLEANDYHLIGKVADALDGIDLDRL